MNAKRVFLAVPASPEVAARAEEFAARYDRLPVRWLKGKNLHLTLVPPWHEENVPALTARLANLGPLSEPFELRLKRITYGPDLRQPRLIWAEGDTLPALLSLRDSLLAAVGQGAEARPFRVHLTLARFRPENFAGFPVKKLDESIDWTWRTDSFVLFESRLLPSGAEYEILKEIKL